MPDRQSLYTKQVKCRALRPALVTPVSVRALRGRYGQKVSATNLNVKKHGQLHLDKIYGKLYFYS
jgi:hypothetical protein